MHVRRSKCPSWALGDQPQQRPLGESVEHVPELSHQWDEEAGVFLRQLPICHCLRAALRETNSPALPSCPEDQLRVFS